VPTAVSSPAGDLAPDADEWAFAEVVDAAADVEPLAATGDGTALTSGDATRDRPAVARPSAPDLPFEWREARIDRTFHAQRLDKALVALAPEFSRSHLQGLIAQGHVELDGRSAAKPAQRLEAGQRLRVQLVPTAESLAYRAEALPLQIVHEDDHLLVIDKPAGLVVHPAPGHWSGTLLNALLAHHAGAAGLPRAGIVHRLDKDTTGLMLVGKTLPAVTALVRAIASRQVSRRYLALAHGRVDPAEQTVDAPIGRDPRSRIRMAVVAERAGGRAARTDFVCLAQLALAAANTAGIAGEAAASAAGPPAGAGLARTARAWPGGGWVSALRCSLHTGRTHQIRVHAASRGHPLLADALYGGEPALGLTRQALHAVELALAHPVSGVPMAWHRPPPADFAAAWAAVVGEGAAARLPDAGA
jgi:23S rRNA pseudouridine1911/1915/1917 synthase